MRWVLYSLRWFTILAALLAGFGFLVWKLAPRPIDVELAIELPADGRYELFVNGSSLGRASTVLDEERMRMLSDSDLESIDWPREGRERMSWQELSFAWGYVARPEGGQVLHLRLKHRDWTVRRALCFQILDRTGRQVTTENSNWVDGWGTLRGPVRLNLRFE